MRNKNRDYIILYIILLCIFPNVRYNTNTHAHTYYTLVYINIICIHEVPGRDEYSISTVYQIRGIYSTLELKSISNKLFTQAIDTLKMFRSFIYRPKNVNFHLLWHQHYMIIKNI